MVRVHGGRSARSIGNGAARHKQAQQGEQKKKSSHKVILEEISEQKKLKTFLSFNAEAPPGFTFIPAGDPQLTNRCKQLARDDGSTVYIVSMSNPKNPELSHEVHRVGYHFSSRVVENACLSLGVTLTESGRVLQSSFATLNEEFPTRHGKKVKSKGKGKSRTSPPRFDLSQSQATIDTQAREAIRDLFPKIPEADLHETVCRSFQKGRDLVGTSSDLSLARRAHLAVLAHIRHSHTQYDHLLKLMPWADARKRVEGPTLDVLISWRDDVDDDTNVMRDVLREVIIISDNEDEDEEDEAEAGFVNGHRRPENQQRRREMSVEIVSVNENVRMQQLDLAVEPPETEDEREIQYITKQNALRSHRPSDWRKEERRGAQRHQRWEQALNRKRNDRPLSPSLTRLVQPILEPDHPKLLQNESMPQFRDSQMQRSPNIYAYDGQGVVQPEVSQYYLPLRPNDHIPTRALEMSRGEPVRLTNPMRKVVYESQQRRNSAQPHPAHHNSTYRTPQDALDRSRAPRGAQQVPPLSLPHNSSFVNYQQLRVNPEMEVIVNGKPHHQHRSESLHRRRPSQRILPSVEMDDTDMTDPVLIRNEAALQHQDARLRENTAPGCLQFSSRSAAESRSQIEHGNLKRARDEEDVYIVPGKSRGSAMYENYGRDAVVNAREHAVERFTRQQGMNSMYENQPHVVEHGPRIIQLPPRTSDEIMMSHREVQPDFRPRPQELRRPPDLSRGPTTILPAEAFQRTSRLELSRGINSPLHSNEYASTSQPSVSRIVHLQSPEEGNFVDYANGSSIHQYRDDQRRALRDDRVPRREAVTYVTSPRVP